MTTIRCTYFPNSDGSRRDPGFPPTDQHPQAVRYAVDHPTLGALNVDAIGGTPTLAEINAMHGLDATGQAIAQRLAADAADLAVCVVDPNVVAFLNMSPADLDAWVAANITAAPLTLAQLKANTGTAITVLGKLALTAARGRRFR